jgi:hypothetical protein
MELKDPPDPRRQDLIPVVTYAVERRIVAGKPDYWDFATQLELAVLGKQQAQASSTLGRALAAVREKWEPETTAQPAADPRGARAAGRGLAVGAGDGTGARPTRDLRSEREVVGAGDQERACGNLAN